MLAIVRFWEDLWCGDMCLKDRFPRLARFYPFQNDPINRFASSSAASPEQVDWNFCFPRNLTIRESCEATVMMGVLDSFKLWEGLEDRRMWLGSFSVKSMAGNLSSAASLPPVPFFNAEWKSSVPNKVQIFSWMVAIKRLNTADQVQKHDPHLSLCALEQPKMPSISSYSVAWPPKSGCGFFLS